MKKVLTVAGSDSGGGAGIQADLKTFAANGVYGLSVITAITSQNTVEVKDILAVPSCHVKSQIDAVAEDIDISAVKIGMVFNSEIAETIYTCLSAYNFKKIVTDPVMVSTSGSKLIDDRCIEILKNKLFGISYVVTPNIKEAEVLSDMKITDTSDMEKACKKISIYGSQAVLIKGGHLLSEQATDILYYNKKFYYYSHDKIKSSNTHGTGCTLSSAIAANLAKGCDLPKAVESAKVYLSQAIKKSFGIGKGNGPVNHFYDFHGEKTYE